MRREMLGLLEDIRDAAAYIADDTAGVTSKTYTSDRRLRQLVERNFITIGEAMNRLNRLQPDVAQQITGYQPIIAFRNVIVHGYDVLDNATIWRAIESSLPILRAEVANLLESLTDDQI